MALGEKTILKLDSVYYTISKNFILFFQYFQNNLININR